MLNGPAEGSLWNFVEWIRFSFLVDLSKCVIVSASSNLQLSDIIQTHSLHGGDSMTELSRIHIGGFGLRMRRNDRGEITIITHIFNCRSSCACGRLATLKVQA
jgi:hypothetical protein